MKKFSISLLSTMAILIAIGSTDASAPVKDNRFDIPTWTIYDGTGYTGSQTDPAEVVAAYLIAIEQDLTQEPDEHEISELYCEPGPCICLIIVKFEDDGPTEVVSIIFGACS